MKRLILVICLLVPFVGKGQSDLTNEIKNLKGIEDLIFIIEPFEADIKADGLREEDIKRDIELKLRLAGITPIDLFAGDIVKNLASPMLNVTIVTVKSSDFSYAVSISVTIEEQVDSIRNPGLSLFAIYWESSAVLSVRRKNTDFVREVVKDKLDKFLIDYLKANPR